MVDSDKDFAFEATFIVDHPSFAHFRSGKPPLHFHPHQEEYIRVVEGIVALEVDGHEYILSPDDGEFRVPPWIIHRLYTVSASSRGSQALDSNIVRFMSTGQKTFEVLKTDLLFFENWYRYQDEALRSRGKVDIVQAMCVSGIALVTNIWNENQGINTANRCSTPVDLTSCCHHGYLSEGPPLTL